jgi:hypothetical protein
MGAPDQDLASVLGQRESVLVGEGQVANRAPWGPALTALLEQALNEEIEPLETRAVARPDSVPMPIRAMFGARTPMAPNAAPGEPARVAAEPARDSEVDDLAETTRQQLTKMYDARVAAPVLVEPEATPPAARPDAPPSRATVIRRERTRVEGASRSGRRKLLYAIVLLVVAVLGVRYVRSALANDNAAAVRDPTTAVDKLPWRTVHYGDMLVAMPTHASSATLVDGTGGSYHYDRYVLPDVTFTITVRDAVPSLSSDAALRSYTTSVASQLGGRVLAGIARDVTFGTSFAASLDLPDSPAQLYVLNTRDSLIELRADIPDDASGRALKIYEQVIRSFSPA